jgi:hypothetical protein
MEAGRKGAEAGGRGRETEIGPRDGEWVWRELPPLPRPLCRGAISAIGPGAYILGGAGKAPEKDSRQGREAGGLPSPASDN